MAEATAAMPRGVRKLRHWKQQFDPNARFVFRKSFNFGEDSYVPGDVMPEEMQEKLGRTKLKLWWEARYIELRDFSDPAQKGELPEPQEASGPAADGSVAPSSDTGDNGDSANGAAATGGDAEAETVASGEGEQSPGPDSETEQPLPLEETGDDPPPPDLETDDGLAAALEQVGMEMADMGGGWYLLRDQAGGEERLRGRAALVDRVAHLLEAATEAETEGS